MGKLYQLSDYRMEIKESGGTEANPSLTFGFEDNAATDLIKTAERDGLTPGELMSRALGLVVTDSELRSEGYEGPIYRKQNRAPDALRGWLSRIGLGSYDQIKLRHQWNIPKSPNSTQ